MTNDMKLVDKQICDDCVGEKYLREVIAQLAQISVCSYCGVEQSTISISDLADYVDTAISSHFQITPSGPDAFEWAMMKDEDSKYDWERKGEPVSYIIGEAAELDEQPADDVRSVLAERYFDFDSAAMGETNPYDEDEWYDEKEVEDYIFQLEWIHFEGSLKTENRLFNIAAESTLSSVFGDLGEHVTRDADPILKVIGPDSDIQFLYRARVFESSDALREALCFPARELGSPPSTMAKAGRMNARGISTFYGALTAMTALSEVRPPVGSKVTVAQFEVVRPLTLLDVEALRSIYVKGSLFDASYLARLEKAKFLDRLSHKMSLPVLPEDEPLDYVITQAIADFLDSKADPRLDGIIYPSTQVGGDGKNIVLFNKSSRVEEIDVAEGSEISASLSMTTEDGDEPDYTVWEHFEPEPEVVTEEPEQVEDDFPAPWILTAYQPIEYDADSREITLRLVQDSLVVHHVEQLEVKTSDHVVSRHRVEKRDWDF